ncbi:MAG: hypothetical protein JO202_00970 [Ktedonobacteraceae bacterium]|nr:hypothetical protein [Ktedonobacteraceae bacterium]
MQQQRQKQQQSQQIFTASEVAEYEYCPLAWWYERFEPLAQADTEELFACLVELEHEHDTQAPTLPEYQMVEQLLVRRGAFEQGQQLHQEHADEVAELEEERAVVPTTSATTPRLRLLTAALVVVALILIVVSLVLR